MILTIGGEPGSGKSTTAKLLALKLNLKHYSNGDFMREMAKQKGISLLELSKLAEKDKTIDRILDERQIQLGKIEDNFVIDSRLGFHFIPHSVKVFLTADLRTRAKRVLSDKIRIESNMSLDEAIKNIKTREISENKRYKGYYGVEPYDKSHFELVIDTSNLNSEQVASKVIEFANNRNI